MLTLVSAIGSTADGALVNKAAYRDGGRRGAGRPGLGLRRPREGAPRSSGGSITHGRGRGSAGPGVRGVPCATWSRFQRALTLSHRPGKTSGLRLATLALAALLAALPRKSRRQRVRA